MASFPRSLSRYLRIAAIAAIGIGAASWTMIGHSATAVSLFKTIAETPASAKVVQCDGTEFASRFCVPGRYPDLAVPANFSGFINDPMTGSVNDPLIRLLKTYRPNILLLGHHAPILPGPAAKSAGAPDKPGGSNNSSSVFVAKPVNPIIPMYGHSRFL